MKTAADQIDWGSPTNADVEEAWQSFCGKINLLCRDFVPISSGRKISNGPPWIDKKLKRMMKSRKRCWNTFKRTQLPEHYEQYKLLRNI
jgi:hypothetical protein